MSARPDIAAILHPGEKLLWQGHPKKGRPMTLGHAQRLVGVNPAAAAVLLVHLRKIGAA